MRRGVRRRVVFPTRAIIQSQVRANFPFVLKIEVVLIEVVLLSIQADLVANLEWQKHVLLQITYEDLSHRRGETIDIID